MRASWSSSLRLVRSIRRMARLAASVAAQAGEKQYLESWKAPVRIRKGAAAPRNKGWDAQAREKKIPAMAALIRLEQVAASTVRRP